MIEDKKILFISKYSKENTILAEQLCQKDNSFVVFWENEDMKMSKMDYFDILSKPDHLSEKFFVIENPESETFIQRLASIVLKTDADVIITRGMTSDIWPISLIKRHFSITHIPFIAILDRINNFNDFDRTVLEPFDFIFGLGPSCDIDIFKNKTKLIFKKKEISQYENFNMDDQDLIIIFCNKYNIDNLSNHPRLKWDNVSFIDPEFCPDEEMKIYLNLSSIIVDESNFEELNWILNKMGKKTFPLKELLEKNHNLLLEEAKDFFHSLETKKVFFKYIKKVMESHLKKVEYSPIVEGSTIVLGD